MRFRRRGPTMAGPDYLIGAASAAADRGQPYAAEFLSMLTAAFLGRGDDAMLLAEMTARRPLHAHEASPVAIIMGALSLAHARSDSESADEVVRVGLALLAKWPAFLLSRVDGHPDFRRKDG